MAKIDRETLVALRERLVAAEGADHALDVAIARWLYETGAGDHLVNYDPELFVIRSGGWTDSIDAAVNLFDRLLPDWSRESGRSGFGSPAWCRVWNPLKSPGGGNSIRAEHNGGCEPIAILIALIDALTSEPANAR